MAFTYDLSLTSDLHKVRFELGDTDEATALFQDEEITQLLDGGTAVLEAAARGCDALARRFARDTNFSADGASFTRIGRSEQYRKLAADLRERLRSGGDTGGVVGSSSMAVERLDGWSKDPNPLNDAFV